MTAVTAVPLLRAGGMSSGRLWAGTCGARPSAQLVEGLRSKGHLVQMVALSWRDADEDGGGGGGGGDGCSGGNGGGDDGGVCLANTHLHFEPAEPQLKVCSVCM